MASVLKKQILKQLARFTKGLKEEDINLSTFKGEGELTSLELDENALMDVLDVPYWVKITSAKCDRVFFQVPFMAIKKVPMSLTLDKVSVEIETCDNVESMAMRENVQTVQPGKYKFINQVIDGMTIQINEVNITFRDPVFYASVQILKILVQSKSPNWESTNLKTTRLKNEQKTQILIFKELTWQMIRIELYSTNDRKKPPIKLFTNDIICRLTIKKRLSDCFILGCKLAVLIEELLCVFTDSQMKAALHYIDSLAGVVKKSTDLSRKKKAVRKLECLPEYQAQLDQEKRGKFVSSSKSSCLFSFHDVIETSYHFVAQKINLHLSDDPGSRSLHPDLEKGGSIQIEVTCFQIDLYPYHLADSDRLHWGLYKKASSSFFQWLKDSQCEFWDSFCTIVRDNFQIVDTQRGNITKYLKAQYSKLMTSCTVLRMSDFTVFRVQSGRKQEQIAFIKERFFGENKPNFLLPPIIYRGTCYADVEQYESCLKLWCHALQISQNNSFREPVDLLQFIQVFCKMIKSEINIELSHLINVLTYTRDEYKHNKNKIVREMKNMKILKDNMYKNMRIIMSLICIISLTLEKEYNLEHPARKNIMDIIRELNMMNLRSEKNMTLLHMCIKCDVELDKFISRIVWFPHYLSMKLLLTCGADVNALDDDGNTPLHFIVDLFLRYPFLAYDDLNTKNVIQELLNAGAHTDIKNKKGLSPHNINITSLHESIKKSPRNLTCLAACVLKYKLNKVHFYGKCPQGLLDFINLH